MPAVKYFPIESDEPIKALPHNGRNGIIVSCCSCGREFEETDNGHYPPIQFERERYDRQCSHCRD